MRLSRICVVTSESWAYYALVSRLRRADLPFASLVPGSEFSDCQLVLTSSEEADIFGDKAVAVEDLDENPEVFKGQILSRMNNGSDVVLVGVDPGKRTGLAVFYGDTRLAFNTFDSMDALSARILSFAEGLPDVRFVVRIGNGNQVVASRLASDLQRLVPRAAVEVVDESGTSARTPKMRGVSTDEGAAARIAFRKGELISSKPRSRGKER
jgi:hypothetical protein